MPFTSKSYSCGSLGRVRKMLNLNHLNWVNVPVPQASGLTLLDIETDPNNGDNVFTVGEADVINPTNFYGIAVSNNGGTLWNIPGGNYQTAVLANTNMGLSFQWNEIIVVNSTLSFVVGSVNLITRFATIAMSTDGGLTYNLVNWHLNCTPNPTTAGLQQLDAFSVHFVNANIGVVGLQNFVIKTTDGGGTWNIMNGGTALSTAVFPNPPGTALPIGNITGIHIKADESVVTAVGAEFIASTIPVSFPNPAGMLIDSWQNNFITASGVGPPINSGFTPNLPIGWHLGGFQPPNDQVIYVSGDAELGIHSTDHGVSGWVNTPAPGWDPSGSGFSRRAAHFYKWDLSSAGLYGLYNQSTGAANQVYWNAQGFGGIPTLSDDLPGLNYAPTAIWTWYEETPDPICYTLTECTDGSTIHTNVNLGAYLGQVITIAEQPGHCYLVSEGCPVPNTPIVVTFVASFVDCATCAPPPQPCACPPGTVQVTLPDGSIVCQEDTVVLAQGPEFGGCHRIAYNVNNPGSPALLFGPSPQYSSSGARFYGETSGLTWPIAFSSSCTPGTQNWFDNSANLLPIINTVSNPGWGDGTGGGVGPWTGRVNAGAGVIMSNTPCSVGTLGGQYGFIHCLNVPVTTTYSFGFMGVNIEILINGLLFVTSGNDDIYQYENWTVMQLTLPAGNYIIQMAAQPGVGVTGTCGQFSFNNPPFTPRNPGSNIGLAFEIYNAPISTLASMTTQGQIDAVVVYSTKNEDGQKMDYGSSVSNYRCPCPPPPALCPSSIGNYAVVKPILDNCTANPLNPNANPNIYVCHTYTYTPLSGCCFLLTDCQNPTITYVTSTNLSLYLNNVINVAEYQGCFTVTQIDCPQGVPPPPPVTVTASFADCPSCLPQCYILTDCQGLVASILTNTNLSIYLGGVINIVGSSTCWQVSLAQGCQGSIAVTVSNSFVDCAACLPVCYLLANCQDPADIRVTNTNLSAYLGQVIKIDGCPDTCWTVNLSPDCNGAVPVTVEAPYTDCDTCLNIQPPPPIELRPRMIKPGYTTPGCPPEYTEKVNCTFAKAAYDQMVISRYGITLCCNEPIEKWDIKKQLLDLNAIYDPELCKNTFDTCCPPCAVVATLTVYNPQAVCPPPTNVIAVLNIPPPTCPAPVNVQAGIVINPTQPCVCYLITMLNPGVPCDFDYTDCNGIPQTTSLFFGINYICSITTPVTSCLPGNYTIQTTPGNCLLGTCGAP